MGCDPKKLVVTAAVKNEQLVNLALQHDVLMILDNEDECRLVNRLAGEHGKTAGIGMSTDLPDCFREILSTL